MKRLIPSIAAAGVLLTGGTFGADAMINPYQDKGTHFELSISSDIAQGEHVEIAKDRAAITLRGWNDEYAITISPQLPTAAFGGIEGDVLAEAKRPFLSKQLQFKSGSATALIEPRSNTEFDLDFTLDAKPDTNVFSYVIEGADSFDFFYQPELTAEEINRGAERPENVVGSYAVYSKVNANHETTGTNYGTGKIAHIYRPKATDAKGSEVWAELAYRSGVLTVTVPQDFLDNAAYPVRVDPTFGYTSQGASDQQLYSSGGGNQERSSKYNLAENGSVTKITAYLKSTGACNYKASIYDDVGSNNTADNKKVIGTETAIPSSSYAQVDSTASVSLTAADYFVGASADGGLVTCQIAYDASVGTSYDCATGSWNYASPPDPWACSGGSTSGSNKHSVYATYTVAATPAVYSPQVQVSTGSIRINRGTIIIQPN